MKVRDPNDVLELFYYYPKKLSELKMSVKNGHKYSQPY